MPKIITLAQTMFSGITGFQDNRKARAISFILLILLFALLFLYFLQAGDLIQKTFLKTAYESKTKEIVKEEIQRINNQGNRFSLLSAEEAIGKLTDFVLIGEIEYIPLTTPLAFAPHLVFSDKR